MGNESNNVPQLEFLENEQDEKRLRAVGKDGLVGVKTKSKAGSVDERTLNDPNHLLQEEREATNAAITSPDEKTDDFPDGGLRAWLCVLGVSFETSMKVFYECCIYIMIGRLYHFFKVKLYLTFYFLLASY